MKFHQTTLANGLRIVTHELPDSPSVAVTVHVGAGSRHEDAVTNNGVSHFLEHLLFKGTKKRPTARVIAEEIDALGGWNNAYTSQDQTVYEVKVPKDAAHVALDLIADMIQNPLLQSEEIERERGVILEELNWRRNDDPMQHIGSLLPPLLWPDDTLQLDPGGTIELVKSIDRQTIVDYTHKYYVPSNIVVSVAGGITHEVVVEIITELMGAMPRGSVEKLPVVKPSLSQELAIVKQKDTAQAYMIIGCRALPYRHPDDPAAKLMATILGSGMSSRLFNSVREERGLAYDIGAYAQNFVDSGLFEVYCSANVAKATEVVEVILEELKLIRDQPVSAEELAKAKQKVRGATMMSLESNMRVADVFGGQMILMDSIQSMEVSLLKYDAVTIEDVQRVARELLETGRLRLAVIAPDPDSIQATFTKLITKEK